jgi:hypothetical protein
MPYVLTTEWANPTFFTKLIKHDWTEFTHEVLEHGREREAFYQFHGL